MALARGSLADPSDSEVEGALSVMAGLDPAIHATSARVASRFKFMKHYQLYQGPRGLTHAGDPHGVDFLTLMAREIRAMPSAVSLREDYSARELRALARWSKDANQSRRLLSLAAVQDGMDRGAAAKIGGMDRRTLRDWVHRFNASGPDGLIDNWTEGPKPRLSAEQLAQFAQIVEAGPDLEVDGVVRWRRLDLKRVIAERFGVDFHPRYVGNLLKKLGFSHISARPPHPAQDERIVEA